MNPPNKQGSREARCPITGCLLDVSIQLAIVMVGKQALNNVVEIGLPKLRNWWRRRKLKSAGTVTVLLLMLMMMISLNRYSQHACKPCNS